MFDREYKEKDFFWSKNPDKSVKLVLNYKKKGNVLDLGVGEGRNALFLAKHGFDVTGVDFSREGIKKFEDIAKKQNLKIKGLVGDLRKFNFDKKYDVIISNATLHFLKENEIRNIIKKLKENTKKSGLNIITVFTEENPGKNFPYLFKKNELKEFYSDWDIIKYKELMTPLEKHGKDGKWHRHGVAIIIAKK